MTSEPEFLVSLIHWDVWKENCKSLKWDHCLYEEMKDHPIVQEIASLSYVLRRDLKTGYTISLWNVGITNQGRAYSVLSDSRKIVWDVFRLAQS